MTPTPSLPVSYALTRRDLLRLIALLGGARSLGMTETAPRLLPEREREERRRKVYEFFEGLPG